MKKDKTTSVYAALKVGLSTEKRLITSLIHMEEKHILQENEMEKETTLRKVWVLSQGRKKEKTTETTLKFLNSEDEPKFHFHAKKKKRENKRKL